MKATVVLLNGSVQAVVSGTDERVQQHLEELAKADYMTTPVEYINYKAYRTLINWYIEEKQFTLL